MIGALIGLLLMTQVGFPFPGPPPVTRSGVAASVVQGTQCSAASGVGTCTTGAITVTSGHAILACMMINVGTSNVFGATGSTGTDTFSAVGVATGTLRSQCLYVASTTSSGSTTFTCTETATSNFSCDVIEIISSNGLDGTATNVVVNTVTAPPVACQPYTTVHNNALVLCFYSTVATLSSLTEGSPFSLVSGATNLTPNKGFGMESLAGIASGTVESPTISPSGSHTYASWTVAFY